MAYPSPGAVGPPVDYDRPRGTYPGLPSVLGHVFTGKDNSVLSYQDWMRAFMHPRASLAAGANSPLSYLMPGRGLGAPIVPGGRGLFGEGIPSAAQQAYLDALTGSSHRPINFLPPVGESNLFQPFDPSVQALAQHLGMPASTYGIGGHVRSAKSPLSHMFGTLGSSEAMSGSLLGAVPGENRLTWKNSQFAPPEATKNWLRGIIDSINRNR